MLEFVPGRIDHHNVQILTLFLMAYGAVRWDGRGGACIGIGSALSVIVGLECLPFVVVAYGGLVIAFALRLRAARAVLSGAALGMAGTTVPGALAFLGVPGSFSTQCDAFSAPYIVLMLGLSAILEEEDGTISYWALAHGAGRPDFHHPACFALTDQDA